MIKYYIEGYVTNTECYVDGVVTPSVVEVNTPHGLLVGNSTAGPFQLEINYDNIPTANCGGEFAYEETTNLWCDGVGTSLLGTHTISMGPIINGYGGNNNRFLNFTILNHPTGNIIEYTIQDGSTTINGILNPDESYNYSPASEIGNYSRTIDITIAEVSTSTSTSSTSTSTSTSTSSSTSTSTSSSSSSSSSSTTTQTTQTTPTTTPQPTTPTTPTSTSSSSSSTTDPCCLPTPKPPSTGPPEPPDFTTKIIDPLVVSPDPPTTINPLNPGVITTTTTTTPPPSTTTTTTTFTTTEIVCIEYCKKLGF